MSALGPLQVVASSGPVIAGLPLTAWLMIVVAGGLGLAIELVFYFRHRERWRSETRAAGSSGAGKTRAGGREDRT